MGVNQETAPFKIFVFSEQFKELESERVVAIGDLQSVAAFLDKEQLSREFGGWLVYRKKWSKRELLGIWGERKASKFRRLLHEAGAEFTIEKSRPRGIQVKLRHTKSTPF